MAGVHSRLSASQSSRWINCPGSPRMVSLLGTTALVEPSIHAQEGIALHELSEDCLKSGHLPQQYIGTTYNKTIINEEHADAVGTYVGAIAADQFDEGGEVKVEVPVDLRDLHPDLGGTCDAALIRYVNEQNTVFHDDADEQQQPHERRYIERRTCQL